VTELDMQVRAGGERGQQSEERDRRKGARTPTEPIGREARRHRDGGQQRDEHQHRRRRTPPDGCRLAVPALDPLTHPFRSSGRDRPKSH